MALPENVPSKNRVIDGTIELIESRLPPKWRLRAKRRDAAKMSGPDAVFELKAPNGTTVKIVVEAKRTAGPATVERSLSQLRVYAKERPSMLVAPYIPPSSRAMLADAGVGYADLTGNLLVRTDEPPVLLRDVGSTDRNPWRIPTSVDSLRGATAGRIVRALCDFRPPLGVRELGKRAGASAGYTSRLLAFLEGERLIERAVSRVDMPGSDFVESTAVGYERRGPVVSVDWSALIQRWTQEYSFTDRQPMQLLEPRGLPTFLKRLKSLSSRYALTGPLVAQRVAPVAPALTATLFVDDMPGFVRSSDLRVVQRGGNVLIAEPFDEVAYARGDTEDGLNYVAFSQGLADLRTIPGRAESEAAELERWMAANESRWRRG
jgi:hypothetical protein